MRREKNIVAQNLAHAVATHISLPVSATCFWETLDYRIIAALTNWLHNSAIYYRKSYC